MKPAAKFLTFLPSLGNSKRPIQVLLHLSIVVHYHFNRLSILFVLEIRMALGMSSIL